MPSVLPLVLLAASVLGITQVVRANLFEELDASQTLQSASAGNPAPSGGSPALQEPAQLNTAEGIKSTSDVASASGPLQLGSAGRSMGGSNSNRPSVNLAPGSYIQFTVAVPPGFLARLDDTPDGGKVITVISPEPPCPNCGQAPLGEGIDSQTQGTATNSFDSAPLPPQGSAGRAVNVQNYQESARLAQRSGQQASPPNYLLGYQGPDQTMSNGGQMYMKNSAYRNVDVSGANQLSYQARAYQNFLPPPPPPHLFQRYTQPPPPPMMQRMVRPPPQYEPMPSDQYQHQQQQQQYTLVNSAPDHQAAPQQQQQASSQSVQQLSETNGFQQQQYQSQPTSPLTGQPVDAVQKFQTAVRSLADGSESQ